MESGSGSYLVIQQGFSIYGQDIYVSTDDKDIDEDENYKVPWFRNRVIVARIIILGAVTFGVLWFILSNMYN